MSEANAVGMATEKTIDIDFDLFQELSYLHDDTDYPAIKKLCDWYIRSKGISPDELHIAYSFKALAQLDCRQYHWAVLNAEKAMAINPGCPWARYVCLQTLEAYARNSGDKKAVARAIEFGERILSDGIRFMNKQSCAKGIPKAEKTAMLNDSRFLLAFLYLERLDFARAKILLRDFLREFDEDTSSFTREEPEEELAKLQ